MPSKRQRVWPQGTRHIPFNHAQFLADRDAALLSLDLAQVRAFAAKYNARFSDDDDVALAAIHKARTGATSLPREARLLSRDWLAERGLSSLGDDL